MTRILGVLVLAAIVAVAAYVYKVKYDSSRLTRQVADLTRQIENERDMISTLRAEWSALNQPTRLQALAERHLKYLKPFTVAQLGLPHELPERPLDLGVFIERLNNGLPNLGPDAGTPTGATRNPIPIPRPQPSPLRRGP